MLIIKRSITCLITLFLFISSFLSVYGDENKYEVLDSSSGELTVVETFDSYKKAIGFYENNIDNYDNLIFMINDQIYAMEYGFVSFNQEDISINTEYTSIYNNGGYLNASYSGEACYLKSDIKNDLVYFKIAGDIGYIDINEVELIPLELMNIDISNYQIIDNKLVHNIKTSTYNNYYSYSLKIDDKLAYLNEDTIYYSYDGIYFYDDLKVMLNDYQNDTYKNSINYDNPYYNYYKYLPHRSYTNYSLSELEDYFYNTLMIDGKIQFYDDLNRDNGNDAVNLSQFYGELQAFFGYELMYGANAIEMISLSAHETAWGKSYLSFTKNNLFGHAAFDSDPEKNASRYASISNSIYAHAKYYVSKSYGNVHSSVYSGSFFGDNKSGMNVHYSSDPYWGEKAASIYYEIDSTLGYKDKDYYAIGIINDLDTLKVYSDDNLTNFLYKLNNVEDYAVIILDSNENVTKIQLDISKDNSYLYNPEICVGYIATSTLSNIINQDKIIDYKYDTYNFDLNDGSVNDYGYLTLKVKENKQAITPIPARNGYSYNGYQKVSDNNYIVNYKQINSIEVVENFNPNIEKDYMYNLYKGKIKVNYIDGSGELLDIDSNMMANYDSSIEGENDLIITYNGVSTTYKVNYSSEITDIRNNLDYLIEKNINSYLDNESYDLDELEYIRDNIGKVDYLTNFKMIRLLDEMLLSKSRESVNYVLKDDGHDLSLSGLALALGEVKQLSVKKPFKDSYYIEISAIKENSLNKLSKIASAYEFEIVDSFKIDVDYNLQEASFASPVIMQVKLDNRDYNSIYSVYELDENGDIIKCATQQKDNYISFMVRSEGEFVVLRKEYVNSPVGADYYENINTNNADNDNHLLFIEGAIFIGISLLGFIMIIVYYILNKKEEKIWNDYRKSLPQAEYVQEEKLKS